MTQRLETPCGLWAGGLSVLVPLLVIRLSGATSGWTMAYLGLVALAGFGVAGGAYFHARWTIGAALPLLWVGATLLVALTIVAMASIGLLLLPGAILAAIAAVSGARVQAAQVADGRAQ